MADSTIRYIFLLIALFIGVAYFTGLATDTKAFAGGLNTIIQSLQGRGPNGQLAAYPKAA